MEIGNTYQHQFVFTQAQVNDFAQVSGDTNPLHLDADFAATTPFKKTNYAWIFRGEYFFNGVGY